MRILRILKNDAHLMSEELEGTAREVIDDEEDKERALEIAEDLSNIKKDLNNLYESVSERYDRESPGRRASEADERKDNPDN